MSANGLTISAYAGYNSTSKRPYYLLRDATDIQFSTQYPGGKSATASFFVPYDISLEWPISLGDRIDIENGLDKPVWQGVVTTINIAVSAGRTGYALNCTGYWGYILMRRNLRKMWVDARIDEQTWIYLETATAAGKSTVDRLNRIKFTPKNVVWSANQGVAVSYIAPTGMTVKRVTCNAILQESDQNWNVELANSLGGTLWDSSTSGTTALDHALGTPVGTVRLQFRSLAEQTPTADGTAYYGQFTNIRVYTETGTITGQTVATYIATIIPEFSTDTSLIGTLGFDLAPHFGAETPRPYADILAAAAAYGDASYNAWAAYVELSNTGGDNKPRLALQPVPDLEGAEYYLSLDGRSLLDSIQFSKTLDDVTNYVQTTQDDPDANRIVFATPDDDSTLVDAAGTAAYGRLEQSGGLDIGLSGTANARNYARRFLAQHSAVKWRVSGSLEVINHIRGAGGKTIPASEICAGNRVRVENFLEDLNGSGLTFLITSTDYIDSTETCSIGVGYSDALPIWLARMLKKEGNLR